MRTHLHLVSAALVALLAFAAPQAHAQSTTTAAITGTVADEAGEPLPGATVLAVHVPSGTEYRAAARGDGGYDLRGLRVGGPYTVTATFLGLTESVQSGLQLALGRTETVDFVLGENARTVGEVVVTADASQVISASRTGAATVVNEETIEALPTISRSISDFARLNPLASGGGSSSIGGRNNRYNNIQVDGATLNDVFGLAGSGTPGGQAGTQPISIDAIAEFNVEVAPYDVRQSGFTGGLINAVTKSGTNQFTGTLRLLGRDQGLVGDRVSNGALVPFNDFREGTGVFTLGGPILRDRLFFFVSGELTRNQFPDNTGFLTPGALPDGNTFRLPADSLQRVVDISQSVYNYDAGGFNILSDNRESNKLLAKIDWNINDANRFSIRHNYVNAGDDTGITRSAGTFALGARRYRFASTQNSTAAQLNTRIGNGAANEARLVFTTIRDSRDPSFSPFPEALIRVTGTETIPLGIDRFSQANSLDQNIFQFTNDFTLFRGDHTITLGTNNELYQFNNLFIQDYYGSYEFAAINEADGGRYAGSSATQRIDVNGDGRIGAVSAIEAFRLGIPSRYQFSYASSYQFDDQGRLKYNAAGNPIRTVDAGAQPRASFDALQLGFYVQDEWQAMSNLRLTGGLRLDVPIFPQTPVENPLVSGTTGVRPDGTTFDIAPAFGDEYTTTNTGTGNLLFSPRVGFNYRTPGLNRQSLQIRGGTGLFTGRTPYVWISNQFSNTGADLARLDARPTLASLDINRDGVLSEDERRFFSGSSDPATQPTPLSNAALNPVQTTEINLIDPDFKFPQVFRTNVGLDQQLGYGFVATVEGIYSKSINDVVYRNLNIVETSRSQEGSDSRPFYGGRVNPNFTNALLLENSSRGYEYSGVLQLQRRVARGLGGSLSYTYNRSENVNNGSSSRAISNWQFNENLDVNDPRLGTTDFEVRHRVLSYLSYSTRYADRFSTELGLVFDTQAGEPLSWIYNGDANGDGQRFNDLAFVPASSDQLFLESNNYPLLNAFIESQPGLRDARGTVVGRNESRAPWQTRLDLELSQGVETVRGQRVDLEVTLVNALNFVNNSWGRLRGTSFNNLNLLTFNRYIVADDIGTLVAGRVVTSDDLGKPVVSFDERTVRDDLTGAAYSTQDFASRWQLRFGVKYSF